MKKSCELCRKEARMYCDSDQASLCWDCDERVHSANFLVAKHSRNLLCHVCQSVMQWKSSGSKFGPTFSVCHMCFNNEGWERRDQLNQETEPNRDDGDSDEEGYSSSSDEDDDITEEEEEDVEEGEDGENQVVPWTTPSVSPMPTLTPTPVATTSSSEIGSFSTRDAAVDSALKRFRVKTFPDSEEEEDGCCSSGMKGADGGVTTSSVGQNQQRFDSEGKRIRTSDVTN